MNKNFWCRNILLAIGMSLIWQPSVAQELAANETVANRYRPALDPLGIRVGGFQLFPELEIAAVQNDNIFAREDDKTSDVTYVFEPRIELTSNWSRHALDAGVHAAIRRFRDNGGEDHEDYTIWAGGRVDVSRSGHLASEMRHARRHEDRESPNDLQGLERTAFDVNSVAVSYRIRPDVNRLYARLEGEYRDFAFEDTLGPSGLINNADRDRRVLSGTLRLGYAPTPYYSLFLQAETRSTRYDDQIDDAGFQRDSDADEISFGVAVDYSGLIFGDIFVGRRSDKYSDPRFADIDGSSFGANLAWNITGLTTLSISGRRSVEPTTIVDVSGIVETRFGLRVDHELRRNLILGLEWSKVDEDFDGILRKDDIDTVDFSARYLMNRRAELVLAYSHRDRDSSPVTATGFRYSRDMISLSARIHW
ncbi:MAG: outer membrane beta-barrel protein [Gammaproteobacteria bacterium]|nr:outer membrane beta-barrel protein [Gammaproteobacteria bacterium]MBT8105314.1 outer membrane beta-barrel protein [Gammaproteobacteria bacterium]NNK25328.1 outer membrane beta-barrel protein [Woeseiaceae bacterium]